MSLESLDAQTTALVVIDLQNGIASMPVEPHAGDSVVANTRLIADKLRSLNSTVILVRVKNSDDRKDVLATIVDQPRPAMQPPADWSDIVLGLAQQPSDLVINKKNWGAFYGTDLDLQLRRRGIHTIILTGISTNMGVESTARNAHEHGYNVVFVEDAMSSMSATEHAFAIERIFPRIGRVSNTAEILTAVN
jgi:nicotinamidase-related amidase